MHDNEESSKNNWKQLYSEVQNIYIACIKEDQRRMQSMSITNAYFCQIFSLFFLMMLYLRQNSGQLFFGGGWGEEDVGINVSFLFLILVKYSNAMTMRLS